MPGRIQSVVPQFTWMRELVVRDCNGLVIALGESMEAPNK
jgi:hypothetical protein